MGVTTTPFGVFREMYQFGTPGKVLRYTLRSIAEHLCGAIGHPYRGKTAPLGCSVP